MTTATMLKQAQGRTISGAFQNTPVEMDAGPPPLGICACLESLHNTAVRLEERVRELEMALSYVLPNELAEANPQRSQPHIPAGLPPAVAEILGIEGRLIGAIAVIERLSEDVAI